MSSIEEDIKVLENLIVTLPNFHLGGSENILRVLQDYARQKQINEEHQKEIAELKEYIFIAPNLDEMTATKYANIQREAYTKGRAEEQQRAEEIINNYYIPKQKIKDLMEKENLPLTIVGGRRNRKTLEYGIKLGKIKACEELLQESEGK